MGVYAKYDGIDGQCTKDAHDKWIDVLSVDWGCHRPGGGTTGQARHKSAAMVDDMTITMDYEKAAPKLQESMLMGKVIPKLELEMTTTYGDGAESLFLKYELKNVMVTSFQTSAQQQGAPTVVVSNNFEEIKVTYTEYDTAGKKGGNAETTFNVAKGVK